MNIETQDGFGVVTLTDGRKYDISGLELPDYGINNDGDAYIFTKPEREELAAIMIKKWADYAHKDIAND